MRPPHVHFIRNLSYPLLYAVGTPGSRILCRCLDNSHEPLDVQQHQYRQQLEALETQARLSKCGFYSNTAICSPPLCAPSTPPTLPPNRGITAAEAEVYWHRWPRTSAHRKQLHLRRYSVPA